MATTSDSSVSFEETDTRHDEMHSTIEQWIDDLVADVGDAQASEEFQEWLDILRRVLEIAKRHRAATDQVDGERVSQPVRDPLEFVLDVFASECWSHGVSGTS